MQREVRSQQEIDISDGKVQILKVQQQDNIDCYRERKAPPAVKLPFCNQQNEEIVQKDAAAEIEQHVPSAPAIKEQACSDEHKLPGNRSDPVYQKIQEHRGGKKEKDQFITVKLHSVCPNAFPSMIGLSVISAPMSGKNQAVSVS